MAERSEPLKFRSKVRGHVVHVGREYTEPGRSWFRAPCGYSRSGPTLTGKIEVLGHYREVTCKLCLKNVARGWGQS